MEYNEHADAEALQAIITRYEGQPVMRRLHIRIGDLGQNQRDEVRQFRFLQRACRESADLAGELADADFGQVATMNPLVIAPETGRIVQAFNRMIEDYWEERT